MARVNREKILSTLPEVELPIEDNFKIVRETLTRIGIPNFKRRELYQTAHILHSKGRYYIVHFKHMFLLDGKPSNITDEDWIRLYKIIGFLVKWGLVKVKDAAVMEKIEDALENNDVKVRIINHSEKDDWELIAKYHFGNNRDR